MKRLVVFLERHQDKIAMFVGLVCVIFLITQRCEQPEYIYSDTIKEGIKKETVKHEQKRDSTKKEAAKTEVKQKNAKERWRSARTNIPKADTTKRDTILQVVYLCDTVIFIDSVLISQLKEVIKQDSVIIQNKNLIIHGDSIAICELRNEVKRRNFKTWWKGFRAGFFTGGAVGVVAGSQIK